jgi:hypothetical protein
MNKNHYNFHSKMLHQIAWEIYVTNKDKKITFGAAIQSNTKPTEEQIWNLFRDKSSFKQHWFVININEDKLIEDKKNE